MPGSHEWMRRRSPGGTWRRRRAAVPRRREDRARPGRSSRAMTVCRHEAEAHGAVVATRAAIGSDGGFHLRLLEDVPARRHRAPVAMTPQNGRIGRQAPVASMRAGDHGPAATTNRRAAGSTAPSTRTPTARPCARWTRASTPSRMTAAGARKGSERARARRERSRCTAARPAARPGSRRWTSAGARNVAPKLGSRAVSDAASRRAASFAASPAHQDPHRCVTEPEHPLGGIRGKDGRKLVGERPGRQ